MERVSTLIQKLQQQLNDKATAEQLLQTTQMLYAELSPAKQSGSGFANGKVFVSMPAVLHQLTEIKLNNGFAKPAETVPQEEKTIEILQVDEKEIEEELEEIKRNAQAKNNMGVNAKPALLFDAVEDVPTLTHQINAVRQNLNDISPAAPESINDKLKESKTELGEKLNDEPIKDLRKGIGVNDRFLFINELFRGDEVMYERSIKTINNFSILAEAEYWIRRELKLKIGWKDSNPFVKQFDQLVKRRFA